MALLGREFVLVAVAVSLSGLALAAGAAGRPAGAAEPRETVIFSDDFGEASRGRRERNTVVDPPPAGMGYTTDTPHGYTLKHWTVVDAEPDKPRRSFWCIPETADGKVESFARQAGRSHDSIAFANTPVPAGASRYVLEFRQWLNDNDYVGFVLGASKPALQHDGAEFGYERQLPKTDQTVKDVYHRGDLGAGKIEGQAAMKRWARHRIEVDGQKVRWLQDGVLLLEGTAEKLKPGGHFGIRQRYERGTRYDDVRITALPDRATEKWREQRPAEPFQHSPTAPRIRRTICSMVRASR